jgi:hypothetical protein
MATHQRIASDRFKRARSANPEWMKSYLMEIEVGPPISERASPPPAHH